VGCDSLEPMDVRSENCGSLLKRNSRGLFIHAYCYIRVKSGHDYHPVHMADRKDIAPAECLMTISSNEAFIEAWRSGE